MSLAGLVGCGGSGSSNTAIPPSNQSYKYVGTQPFFGVAGGVYGMTIDHSTNYFNLADQGYYFSATVSQIGNFTNAGEFEKLAVTESNAPFLVGGTLYGVEVPGDSLALETSSDAGPAAFAESTSSCAPLDKPATFQFVQLGGTDRTLNPPVYGMVTVNTAQANWAVSNFAMLLADGTNSNAPSLANGVCGPTAEGYAATIPFTSNGSSLVDTVAISPNGYFIMDRDAEYGSGLYPLAGVIQPSSPLNTSALIAAKYAGFEYDYAYTSPQVIVGGDAVTQPIVFSGADATGTQMVGGVFPSDDPTQTPGANFLINPGTQDSGHNGIYPSITVTLPDLRLACRETPYAGKDASGNPTCVFPGVAVAGNPGGKYVLYVTFVNATATSGGQAAPYAIQFLLYQQ